MNFAEAYDDNTGEVLNEIIRGEIAATETYEQVLKSIDDDERAPRLREFYTDHEQAVTTLKSMVRGQWEEPDRKSGAWGTFAESVTGAAKVFGDDTALKALKQGEEHGLKLYQDAMEKDIDATVKLKIRTQFIPAQRQHIEKLDEFLSN